MLWPLLLSVFAQQPAPPTPPVTPGQDGTEIEVVEVPSPLTSKRHQVIKLSGAAVPQLVPLGGLASLELEMSALYRRLRTSLVEVRFEFEADPEAHIPSRLLSSGVIMDNYGLFVAPVILSQVQQDALSGAIKVYRTDGQVFEAELVAFNLDYGVSLLRAKQLRGLAPQFGHGLWMEEGAVTIGLGHPFGLPNSLSLGFLTGRQRGIGKAAGLLQITNPVNVGDRGGLLANRHGQVVGMMLTSLSDAARHAEDDLKLYVAEYGNDSVEGAKQAQGISFAMPVEVLFKIFPKYFPQKSFADRRIGVYVEAQIHVIEEPNQEPCHVWEVVVTGLMPQTPGERSGLLPGDVVISLGGELTGSLQELGAAIAHAQQSTTIVVRRGEETLELPLEFEL
jgi:S1-C subfamily serine protease